MMQQQQQRRRRRHHVEAAGCGRWPTPASFAWSACGSGWERANRGQFVAWVGVGAAAGGTNQTRTRQARAARTRLNSPAIVGLLVGFDGPEAQDSRGPPAQMFFIISSRCGRGRGWLGCGDVCGWLIRRRHPRSGRPRSGFVPALAAVVCVGDDAQPIVARRSQHHTQPTRDDDEEAQEAAGRLPAVMYACAWVNLLTPTSIDTQPPNLQVGGPSLPAAAASGSTRSLAPILWPAAYCSTPDCCCDLTGPGQEEAEQPWTSRRPSSTRRAPVRACGGMDGGFGGWWLGRAPSHPGWMDGRARGSAMMQ